MLDPVAEVYAVQKAIYANYATYGDLAKAELRQEFAAQFRRDIEEVDGENTQDQARWAEIAGLCQPNGG